MVKKVRCYLVLLCLLLISAGCSNGQQPISGESNDNVELTISAAASLTDALVDLKPLFESENPTITLSFNPGGSGKLAQQIEQGAPSDVFLSASKKDMDKLQERNLILEDSRTDFAENELVLITNKEKPFNLSSFEEIDRAIIDHFAIGEPESVPVGRYTKQVLEKLGLGESLQSKLVLSSDVRQVLTHVEMGNADIGIVYASDAMISDKVKVLAVANPEWHDQIVYPGAVIADTAHPEEAKAFIAFLTGKQGKEVLRKFGFK
ncbi:molybdate ABC transporter substrate-binding protein [Sporosarcina sp. FSL K6-1508]|uniref:molybdate ABC transporter substrate-binding protein n=1 Tax=Sporosarcina sp. FSL K6-1508 TaxID=2921553 RepID=UPI0030F4E10E